MGLWKPIIPMEKMNLKCKECGHVSETRRQFLLHIKRHNLTTEEYYVKHHDIQKKKCLYCDNDASWNNNKLHYNDTCSDKKCIGKFAQEASKRSIKEKYGVDNISQLPETKQKVKQTKKERYGSETYNNTDKRKQTNLNIHGVDNVFKSEDVKKKIREKVQQHDKNEILEKRKQTNLNIHGVEHVSQSQAFKEQLRKNSLEKWGTEHPMQSEIYKKTFYEGIKEKYGVDNVSQLPETRDKIRETHFKKRKERLTEMYGDLIVSFPSPDEVELRCPKCHETFTGHYNFFLQRSQFSVDTCLHCNPYKSHLQSQRELHEFVSSLGFETQSDHKIHGSNLEIDTYVPSKKIGFEFNGLYWHNEIYRPKDYHYQKKMLGVKNGINHSHMGR